ILDAPPGTSCPVIEATKDADFVILITEPTPFGLHDLTLAVDTLRLLGKDFAVVLNRFGIGDDKVLHYCDKEEITLLARIPNSRAIAETYAVGKLLFPVFPEVRSALDTIASSLRARKTRQAS
ncbi:MAG: ATPase, partial [Deltaproteobacteria bacterium]|nr:ATPase [Deltaproteobacteria bacterium]